MPRMPGVGRSLPSVNRGQGGLAANDPELPVAQPRKLSFRLRDADVHRLSFGPQPGVMSDLGKSARGLLVVILAVYLVPNHRKRCRRTFFDWVASPGKSD